MPISIDARGVDSADEIGAGSPPTDAEVACVFRSSPAPQRTQLGPRRPLGCFGEQSGCRTRPAQGAAHLQCAVVPIVGSLKLA